MHYVIGDIHNELGKLKSILKQINLEPNDELIVLGDVFDRGADNPDPVGVYFELCKIQGTCIWIRGNHDQWLADYIKEYYGESRKKRKRMQQYCYNSFELMLDRLTPVDMLNIADLILELPLQVEKEINGKSYLFAHAMTFHPRIKEKAECYLMGNYDYNSFLFDGVEGYISMCGHTPTGNLPFRNDLYLDTANNSIWCNEHKNVYLLDCGCGSGSGKLACLCIETGKRYYSASKNEILKDEAEKAHDWSWIS